MFTSVLAICALAAAVVPEKVAFFGDSITEGGRYLTHMQLFSALRHPGAGIECYNVGKGGDTAKKDLKTVELNRSMTELLKAHPEAGLVGGDRVHPTDAGQYLMACLCLEATGANPIVDRTTIDAAGRDVFDFEYAPKALPLPVTSLYKAIEKVWPVTERLNRELLTVRNLPAGRYALKADGREIGRYSAAELAAGVNLALLDTPNARRAARAEHLRARLHQIACDFRSDIRLVQRDALKAEERETRAALWAVRPAVSRFSVERLGGRQCLAAAAGDGHERLLHGERRRKGAGRLRAATAGGGLRLAGGREPASVWRGLLRG